MKTVRYFSFALLFGLIATGAIPIGAPVPVQALTQCQITDVTPGGCEYAQSGPDCHCDFVGSCPQYDTCLDAWQAAIDTCDSLPDHVLEGFDCTDVYDEHCQHVEFSFHCGPRFWCIEG